MLQLQRLSVKLGALWLLPRRIRRPPRPQAHHMPQGSAQDPRRIRRAPLPQLAFAVPPPPLHIQQRGPAREGQSSWEKMALSSPPFRRRRLRRLLCRKPMLPLLLLLPGPAPGGLSYWVTMVLSFPQTAGPRWMVLSQLPQLWPAAGGRPWQRIQRRSRLSSLQHPFRGRIQMLAGRPFICLARPTSIAREQALTIMMSQITKKRARRSDRIPVRSHCTTWEMGCAGLMTVQRHGLLATA